MQKQPIYSYFYFGTCVMFLQLSLTGKTIFPEGAILDNIEHCLKCIGETLHLTVTEIAASELRHFRDSLSEIKDKDSKLTAEQASKLSQICTKLRPTVDAELITRQAYVVTPKRYDTTKLIDDFPALMSPGVFASLSKISKYDLSEAGKCIAFERPTAAAFHLLRATESELRHFYCTLIKTKKVPKLLWGDMVEDLRKRRKIQKYIPLYNNLDSIRIYYRNPTQHPDIIYNIEDVQDLCPLCLEVINRMRKLLPT
jgi:hypothetical protein